MFIILQIFFALRAGLKIDITQIFPRPGIIQSLDAFKTTACKRKYFIDYNATYTVEVPKVF